MKRCIAKRNAGFNCGSYAFNLQDDGIDQGELCDVHYYKHQRDTLLTALKSLIKSLSDNDEEGLIEHTQPMMDARAAVEAVEGKPLLDDEK